ncbi:glycosyltransferase [Flavobacterium sp. H122]|uniref:glycosyltransferase n=1 Tax=Flavobacterium sp. H122 TaxID=2529860 RepID=UPI0010AA1891|nr:glycosyltransferase [Flavobacterium sp. H122]
MSFKYNFSIVICCYNSEERISKTLHHIARQKIKDDINWEVIVVNNNSTDLTTEKAFKTWEKINSFIDFKIIDEINPGLSFARKKGTLESRGEYILFCDDDNWLDENYIQTAFEITQKDSKIGMLGGIGTAFTIGDTPEWFEKAKIAYAVGAQNETEGDITYKKGYVYGAGAIVKKELLILLDEIGFAHVLTDRIGKKIVSGGDNEIGYAIVLLGYKIYYSQKLKFQHYIPDNRLNLKYLKKFKIGQTYTYTAIKTYEDYIFKKDTLYKPLTFKNCVLTNLKEIVLINIQYFKGETSYSNYYLNQAKWISNIKYYFFNKYQDYNIYVKVQNNIKLIENYIKS